ncbi:nucleotide disphospho-sugar-binding domain-containing protein [Kitasatospora viridis]|uniref:MGT family glycosyltransferase n=1 Tax=Kitasatospora viridis TaxID=281105 RepID=A0A561UC93_9ACTN|nr:nucleotide disphospho-sugar-binding domain-containing protein [Kitasatospora viridis]TWF96982.1 MGT family glycosyltransferase [Kitasatospora viridis]
MSRIITAAIPVHGHTGPLLAITADLVARGHEVVFLGGSRFAKAAAETGARFVALPAESDFDDRDLAAWFPAREATAPGPERLVFDVKHIFTDPVPGQYRALRELLAEFPADAVIADLAFNGAAALALALPPQRRPAVISIGTSAPTLPSVDTAPFGLALPPEPGEAGRARNRTLNERVAQALAPLADYLAETFAGLGLILPAGSHRAVIPALADHYLLLTVPGLEYPRSDAPANFRCVGALPAPLVEAVELPHWWPELTGGRPVVVVTQGTVANRDLSELVAPTVRGLADRDVLLVAATARADGPGELAELLGELPGNTRVGGYLPFELLLPHADLLVTNGGYGGVHAALRHGVPLVVAGATEDKPEVAARVQWAGAGVDLRTGRPEPAAIAGAVDRVLGDAAHRERARALRGELAAHRPLDTIAALVADLG